MSDEQGRGWAPSSVSESMLEGELLMGTSASLPSEDMLESTRFLDNSPALSTELPVPERGLGPPLESEAPESVLGLDLEPTLLSEPWLLSEAPESDLGRLAEGSAWLCSGAAGSGWWAMGRTEARPWRWVGARSDSGAADSRWGRVSPRAVSLTRGSRTNTMPDLGPVSKDERKTMTKCYLVNGSSLFT